MRNIELCLVVFFLFLTVGILKSQTRKEFKDFQDYKNYRDTNNKYNYNLVKKICFLSNGIYYPLTVVISPYGYWFTSEIHLGHKANTIIQHKGGIFGWGISKVKIGDKYYSYDVSTSNNYRYDTITTDTMYSVFENIKCINNTPELPKTFSSEDSLINITDSNSYELLTREFKYSYLLKDIQLPKDSCEIIRCIYPLNVYYPYKTSFAVVVLKIWPDKIEMISNSLNTVNLLDIKPEKYGKVTLKKNDFKRLKKIIAKTPFGNNVNCDVCSYQSYKDFDFIIDYKTDESYFSYFLCENILLHKKEKSEKKTISYLSGIYNFIYYLNSKYFNIERKNK
ncbi:MAG: hypothetical protein DRI87_09920 [Bacteroidetes bacterium]|nr:MAG: hypothetical protein DRI87_09920 [Bacteroidota bacterium]